MNMSNDGRCGLINARKGESMETTCLNCTVFKCRHPEVKKPSPEECPRKKYPKILKGTLEKNRKDSNRKVNLACDEVLQRGHDSTGYNWTRVRELVEYSRRLKYKKIGIAGCIGLIEESKTLGNILKAAGFQVVLVNCMAGGMPRRKMSLPEGDDGAMKIVCNPLMQAEVLNEEKTELNVLVGLCLGHDILFIRHSKADVTPLIVKDRVLGHNPIAALYTQHSYYKDKLWNLKEPKSPPKAASKRKGRL